MQELTLTGGTLLDTSSNALQQGEASHSHGHNHGHSHGHSHNHKSCCGDTPLVQPILKLAKPPAELAREYDDAKMYATVEQVIRMGPFEMMMELIQAWKKDRNQDEQRVHTVLHEYDPSGHTLTHWAVKRVDEVRFIDYFLNKIPFVSDSSTDPYPSPIHRPTMDDTKMTPLHWLCTLDASIPILKLLLARDKSILELRDATLCTPLLIAAQHGNVNAVAHLIQSGANMRATDTSKDTATHWAAYKGSERVLGLLSYFDEDHRLLGQPDAYGQTPLHLAALRGHVSSVRYVLERLEGTRLLRDLVQSPDANGRTPYQLAVHKKKHAVAAELDPHKTTYPFQCNVRTLKLWLGIPDPEDMDQPPIFPMYFVWANLLAHSILQWGWYCPILNVGAGVLWDAMIVHLVQFCLWWTVVYCLYKIRTVDPGSVKHMEVYKRNYETAVFSNSEHVCHTCHIARPLRSKHDRFSRSCILQFDHNCPFVGASIGLYNYKWFYLFLVTSTLYLFFFGLLTLSYYQRTHATGVLITGMALSCMIFFPAAMWIYHSQLVALNLTTNEHINLHKYEYLRKQRPYSPWDQGIVANFVQRLWMTPGEHNYVLARNNHSDEEEQQLRESLMRKGSSGVGSLPLREFNVV